MQVAKVLGKLVARVASEAVNDVRGYFRRRREPVAWPDPRTATTIW
jgi:hypothetical protein